MSTEQEPVDSQPPAARTNDALLAKIHFYGAWLDDARNRYERRARAEAVLRWLDVRRDLVGEGQRAILISTAAAIRERIESLPPAKRVVTLPEFRQDAGGIEENVIEDARETVAAIRGSFPKLPPPLARDIEYCLAATEGLPFPGTQATGDQVFATQLRGIGIASLTKDRKLALEAGYLLQRWAGSASIHSKFDRKALLRRVVAVTTFLERDFTYGSVVHRGMQRFRRYRFLFGQF